MSHEEKDFEKRYKREDKKQHRGFYLNLRSKLYISHGVALAWLLLSIYLSIYWVQDLAYLVTLPIAILMISGIAYIPGYINSFTVSSLILDKQPKFKVERPTNPITVLIPCHNEAEAVGLTLQYLYRQDYGGEIRVIVIDNNSTDNTAEVARTVGEGLGMHIRVLKEEQSGKHFALNSALSLVDTEFVITLDADTLLMPKSVNYLVARQLSSPEDVVATAGSVLVRNAGKNFWTKIQEWDYFLGIASIKRMQGMYQGTLVAQGAYSLYLTDKLRELGGYPDVIGEDIVITWELLKKGYKVYFEPYAVAFTDVPENFTHFRRQRSRWARGMIEALRRVKPWQHSNKFVSYATSINLLMPFTDLVFSIIFIPGVILAFMGYTWIAGPMTLLLLPLAFAQSLILFVYQRRVFRDLDLRIRRNWLGFFFYILLYQALTAPISLYGYLEEVFNVKRVWK